VIGRLPLLHSGKVTGDEFAVFVGFALVLGLVTFWIDHQRKRAESSVDDDPESQQRDEDRAAEGTDDGNEAGVGKISNRVGAGQRLAVDGVPQEEIARRHPPAHPSNDSSDNDP
jgi:hypothetical protein